MANIITLVRVVCAVLMVFCPAFSVPFYALYGVGCVSDVLDGFVARRLGRETALGARLDTAADVLFVLVVLVKVVRALPFPVWLVVWIVLVALLKVANAVTGLVRYGRFFAEHTVLNKLCGVLLFSVPLCVGFLPWRAVEMAAVVTCVASTVAAVQEGYYIRAGKEIK